MFDGNNLKVAVRYEFTTFVHNYCDFLMISFNFCVWQHLKNGRNICLFKYHLFVRIILFRSSKEKNIPSIFSHPLYSYVINIARRSSIFFGHIYNGLISHDRGYCTIGATARHNWHGHGRTLCFVIDLKPIVIRRFDPG